MKRVKKLDQLFHLPGEKKSCAERGAKPDQGHALSIANQKSRDVAGRLCAAKGRKMFTLALKGNGREGKRGFPRDSRRCGIGTPHERRKERKDTAKNEQNRSATDYATKRRRFYPKGQGGEAYFRASTRSGGRTYSREQEAFVEEKKGKVGKTGQMSFPESALLEEEVHERR